MKQTPLFLTAYAMARLLKEFAQRLGVEESMADAMAQVHMQQTNIPLGWTSFITKNCARCAKAPDSCDFLNPQERNSQPGARPEDVRSANATVIESGKLAHCPSRQEPRISERPPTTFAVEGESQ